MKNILFALTLILSVAAFASGAEHGGHDEGAIPLKEIGWQAANLGILVAALFFYLRESVKESFAQRRLAYVEQAERTKSALKNAEMVLSVVKEKLSSLEAGETKSLQTAQSEAAQLKANLIKDAEAASEKIKKDAELSIGHELNKAKAEINQTILNGAMSLATQKLAQSQPSAQEAAFVKQLEQVRP
jgi:F-type H+-transporting ATPase subunit b